MTKVYVWSDLHFGHTKIIEFAGQYREGATHLENLEILKTRWNERVTKRDIVYVLGDVAMGKDNLRHFGDLHGTKILIRGNHDAYDTRLYLEYFKDIYGLHKYRRKGFACWMSHGPIHPDELRGKVNLHGHVHQNSIRVNGKLDERYVNCCVENSDGGPISMDEIVAGKRTWGKIV